MQYSTIPLMKVLHEIINSFPSLHFFTQILLVHFFPQMKALQGIKMCFRLQSILQAGIRGGVVRGLHNPDDNSSSLNAFLYNVLRTHRSHRRAILTSLLNLLDDSAVSHGNH